MVVLGKQDMVIPLDTMEATRAHFKNEIVREDNAHMIPVESPEWFVETVKGCYEKQ